MSVVHASSNFDWRRVNWPVAMETQCLTRNAIENGRGFHCRNNNRTHFQTICHWTVFMSEINTRHGTKLFACRNLSLTHREDWPLSRIPICTMIGWDELYIPFYLNIIRFINLSSKFMRVQPFNLTDAKNWHWWWKITCANRVLLLQSYSVRHTV